MRPALSLVDQDTRVCGKLEIPGGTITHVHTYTQVFSCMHTIHASYPLTRTLEQIDYKTFLC